MMGSLLQGGLALLLVVTGAGAAATAASTAAVATGAQAAPAPSQPPLRLDAAHSTVRFEFRQAGAATQGRFGRLSGSLQPGAAQPGTLDVAVDVASVDTGDAERDGLLRGPDLFDAQRHPVARYRVTRLAAANADAEVILDGTLTLRGVSRPLRIAAQLAVTGTGSARTATLTGTTIIRRLDVGVGQGEWASTQWIANEVRVSFHLLMKAAP
jgi:polyisoprenoid-binding protein YceI